jgi:hypothetical protein
MCSHSECRPKCSDCRFHGLLKTTIVLLRPMHCLDAQGMLMCTMSERNLLNSTCKLKLSSDPLSKRATFSNGRCAAECSMHQRRRTPTFTRCSTIRWWTRERRRSCCSWTTHCWSATCVPPAASQSGDPLPAPPSVLSRSPRCPPLTVIHQAITHEFFPWASPKAILCAHLFLLVQNSVLKHRYAEWICAETLHATSECQI